MMIRPDNATEYPDIDLKLGIKSSLPNVKATLALLVLLWRVSNKAATLEYCEEDGDGVKLTDELTAKLHALLRVECDDGLCSFDTFDGLIQDNQMLKSQLEALIVAFELVWKMAKIRFSDEKKPSSAERTGGKRFAKKLSFTINMDLLDILFQNNTHAYTKVLLNWMGVKIETDPKCEVSLLRILTVFEESAVYKLSDGDKDVVFNLRSLYAKLISAAREVDINGDKEAKGPLRVLKSSLSEHMNPYLNYKDGSVALTDDGKDVKCYSDRVDAYLSLSTSKIMGYRDSQEDDGEPHLEGTELDEYQKAAVAIRDYVFSTGYELETSEDDLHSLYDGFNAKFSPDALSRIPDSELLTSLFYSSESTNDCLCYWLEFNLQIKKYFGSIADGSSFKFGLYQRKEDNVWVSGSPAKPEELSDADALHLGRSIRDMLIKGAEIISSCGKLDTLDAYETLDDKLNAAIGKYAGFAWIHKYYHMVFPTKFAAWHSSEWQRHLLLAYGIHPSSKYYGRSGQLAIIAKYANMSAALFSGASYDRFGDIKQFCRLGTSDGTKNYFSEWRQDGIAAIGWPAIGSLDSYLQGNDVNRKAVNEKLTEVYYPSDNRTASRKAGELATYYRTNENTIFVAMDGESLLALGDEVGAYFFTDGQKFPHRKPTTWHVCFTSEDRLPNKSEGLRTSCILLSDNENLLYLYHKYYYELSDEGAIEMGEEEKTSVVRVSRENPLHPLNQIIYGAPGTGKTYSSIEYAMAIVENRPVDMTQRTKEQRQELMHKYSEMVATGQVVFTTFHQSYGYEEFIQGIRPDAKAGAISFKKVDGVFKTIADAAMQDPEKNYVIIIDEINRGNISKIFGELITLIEDDKRCGELNQLSVTLPLGERFSVPNNLYVIGTMNSADKSISLIDTALRRRFVFVEMAPNESLIGDSTLRNVLLALNAYIKKELRSTDLLIGHAYFIGKTANDLETIMNNNIIPLLYEYFYDDEAKVKKALDCLADTNYVIDGDCRGRIRIKKKD